MNFLLHTNSKYDIIIVAPEKGARKETDHHDVCDLECNAEH